MHFPFDNKASSCLIWETELPEFLVVVPYGVCWMIGPDIEVGDGYQ